MTQEQIINGLECCTYKDCKDGCPYYGEQYCRVSLKLAALNMIQDQRKQIEELAEQIAIKLQGGCE
jgi:hypothetical protein